jgi:hypothetical protein
MRELDGGEDCRSAIEGAAIGRSLKFVSAICQSTERSVCMKRIGIEKNGRGIGIGSGSGFSDVFSDVWSTVPWLTLRRPRAHYGQRIDGGAEQAQHLSAHASQNEGTAARTVAGAAQQQGKEETKQQGAALNAWENEGGREEQ